MTRETLQEKAERLVREGRVVQDEEFPSVYWVKGDSSELPHRVQLTADYTVCTCSYGMGRGWGVGGCSHVLAARLLQ